MNRIFIWVYIILIAFGSCKTNKEKSEMTTAIVNNPVTADGNYDESSLPKFEFENKYHDFGIIIQGEKVSYTFRYKNIGGSDLLIRSAKATCGCTVPKWSREPLAPGKEDEIEIIFKSSGRKGIQNKTITLLANTQPNKVVLTITGEVITPNE